MSEKTEVKDIKKILGELEVYLIKLSWFPGNAALKWLANSASKTQDIAKDRKQVIKNANEMLNYIEELPWAEGNAALGYTKDELKKCLNIYGVRVEKRKPDYDDPNPQPDTKSDADPKSDGEPEVPE